MKNYKKTIFLGCLLLLILSGRWLGISVFKISLGLDSVYLKIIDIVSTVKRNPVFMAYNPVVEWQSDLNGIPMDSENKNKDSYFNIISGELVLRETDYIVFPKGNTDCPNPLSFQRVYYSENCVKHTPLGYGWSPMWYVELFLINDIYVFKNSSGEVTTFKYNPQKNKYYVLKKSDEDCEMSLISDKNTFLIKSSSGLSYEFSNSDKEMNFLLKRILYSNGIAYKTGYNSQSGCIDTIEEENTGRKTVYSYNPETKLIDSVLFPSGYKLMFEYDAYFNLVKVESEAGNYEKVYSYEEKFFKHLVTASGEGINRRSFFWENMRLFAIETAEKSRMQVERDYLLGLTKIRTMTGAEYYFSNHGDLILNISGPLEFKSTVTFDDSGRVIKYVDSQNQALKYSWDKSDRLIERQTKRRGVEIFEYNDQGEIIRSTDALENVTLYGYEEGLIVKKELPSGDILKMTYKGQLLETKGWEGEKNDEQFVYNDSGLKISDKKSNANETHYLYNEDGYILQKESPGKYCEKYKWNGGNLLEIKYRDSEKTDQRFQSFEYNEMGYLTAKRDKKGDKTSYEYDSLGNIIAIHQPSGASEKYKWNPLGQMLEYSHSDGTEVQFAYDPLNRIEKVITNGGLKIWQFEYKKENGVNISPFSFTFSGLTDPDGLKTEVIYDPGYLIKEVNKPSGEKDFFEYDVAGNLISWVHNKNRKNTFYYDKNNRLNYIYDNSEKKVYIVEYDREGRMSCVTDNNSNTYRLKTDASGNYSAANCGWLDQLVSWQWTADNSLSQMRLKNGLTFENYYNDVGKISGILNPYKGYEEFIFDAQGLISSEKFSMGNQIQYSYYPNKLLKSKSYEQSGIRYQWVYDLSGRIKSVTGVAPYQITWADQKNEVLKITFDKKNTLLMSYTESGKLIKKTFPGMIIQQNKYNKKGLVENISENGLDPVLFEYDSFGRVSQIRYPNKVITRYEYDYKDRIIDQTTTGPEGKQLFKRGYTYGESNREEKIETERGIIKRKYSPLGQILYEEMDDKEGTKKTYRYREDYLPESVQVVTDKESYEIKYIYDEKLRPVKILTNNRKQSFSTEKFRMNLQGVISKEAGFLEVDRQVVQIAKNQFQVDNVLLKPGKNSIPVHTISSTGRENNYSVDIYYDPEAYQTYQYDLNGNVVFKSEEGMNTVYSYNDGNFLETCLLPIGNLFKKIKYTYYANGILCFREVEIEGDPNSSPQKIQFLFDENERVIGKFDVNNTGFESLYMYSPAGDILIRLDRGQKKYYYHLDNKGSVIGVTNHLGEIAGAYTYDAFGEVYTLNDDLNNPFLYLGHMYDKESGFYFEKFYSGLPYSHYYKYNPSPLYNAFFLPEDYFKLLFPFLFEEMVRRPTPESLSSSVPLRKMKDSRINYSKIQDSDCWYTRKP